RQSHAIIWVGDGSEISNAKLVRAYEALSVREQNEDVPLFNRLNLIYNKFSNKTGKTVGSISIKNVGGAPRFEHASTEQVLEQLKNMEMFERII
ncbi:MAG: chromosome partitioning protein ParA, partial [Roseburia sp.]|nr:chromosome partitioning protein ParA [Roseburia sp.]